MSEFVHQTDVPYVTVKQETELKIKTPHDIERVVIRFRDPFTRHAQDLYMRRIGEGKTHVYWKGCIPAMYKRIEYMFVCYSSNLANPPMYVGETGVAKEEPAEWFRIPYAFQNNVNVPKWVAETVWYHIFPDRFAKEDETDTPAFVPTYTNVYGGTIQGIIKHLSYLEELGVTGLYLTPVFLSSSNHKYDIIDYFQIDPQFGTNEDLRMLVKECKEREIRVLLDAVFNHCSIKHPIFQKALQGDEESRCMFCFHENGTYETFGFEATMPKWDTANPVVVDYLVNAGVHWIKEAGIHGWRLDVANEVHHQFWKQFREEVRKEDEESYLVGEAWNRALPWLKGDEWDGATNYPLLFLFESLVHGSISVREFHQNWTDLWHAYPEEIWQGMMNLSGSHDTRRLWNRMGGDERKVKAIFLLLFSSTGAPSVYYGDEIGMEGEGDPDCRRPMRWTRSLWNQNLLACVKELISLRRNLESWKRGSVVFYEQGAEHLLFMEKNYNEEKTITALSLHKPVRFHYEDAKVLMNTGKDLGGGWYELAPYEWVVLQYKNRR